MIISTRVACLFVLAAFVTAAGVGSLTKWGMDRRCIADIDVALRAGPDDVICGELRSEPRMLNR